MSKFIPPKRNPRYATD